MSLENYIKAKEKQLDIVSSIRVDNAYPAKTYDCRTNADADYSRILYASHYQRLQGKMQLFAPKSTVL